VIPLALAAVVALGVAAVFLWARRRQGGEDLYRTLEAALPGKTPALREITRGAAVEGWKVSGMVGERGVLALYDDELVFVVPGGEPARIPLSAIREVTRVRSVESFMARKSRDEERFRDPQWMLKLEWRNGDEYETATWMVAEPDDWIAALPRRR
jgi:hypothetical protein